MRKEVRHAVDEIRTELERVIVKTKPAMQGDVNGFQRKGSEVVQAISEIRSYTTKLEESEKRKQELLAELAAEEQRGQELTKIVKELLPGVKQTVPERPSHFRRRSNDKAKMSKHLSEEAEKYFEDFISSVEDTDISSLDGERSDGSSTVGGITKSPAVTETRACLAKVVSLPAEIDGLVLPWLEWETRNDNTQSCKSKKLQAFTCSRSSRGSWSPGDNGSYSVISKNKASNNIEEAECHLNSDTKSTSRVCSFNMDEYMYLQDREDFLFEGLRQRQRIESGGLILCGRNFVSYQ
uniref:Cell division control protein 6 6 n=2 Tax=Anthurium amnicola TaxID=1678845 RepID=A0A1D1Y6X9_9ARAE